MEEDLPRCALAGDLCLAAAAVLAAVLAVLLAAVLALVVRAVEEEDA